jgi:hypothetical protein
MLGVGNIMVCIGRHQYQLILFSVFFTDIGSALIILNVLSRRDCLVVCTPYRSHTHMTNSHLLKGENPPMCIGCRSRLTI